jgi:hypothetical protein
MLMFGPHATPVGAEPVVTWVLANVCWLQDILRFVKDQVPVRGDAQAVLDAIDAFSTAFPM